MALLHLAFGPAMDPVFDLEDLQLPGEVDRDLVQAVGYVHGLQERLLLGQGQVQVEGGHVGQVARVFDVEDGHDQLGRNHLAQFYGLAELVHHDLHGVLALAFGGDRLFQGSGQDIEAGSGLEGFLDADPGDALDHRAVAPVGQAQGLQDGAVGSRRVQVAPRRVFLGGILLGHHHQASFGLQRTFQGSNRALAADQKRDDQMGEEHHFLDWNQVQFAFFLQILKVRKRPGTRLEEAGKLPLAVGGARGS